MSERARLRLGAELAADGARFTVFAHASSCGVRLEDDDGRPIAELDMPSLGDDFFQVFAPGVKPGALYRFIVDGKALPDPYARELPRGVHGPAKVVRSDFVFRHAAPTRPLAEQVIYELHVGTFTEEGTFAAARRRLPALVELGITTLELMPLAAFAGHRGWGYDGVALFAPHADYGAPDELRQLIDDAHGLGLGVLLDVVYNHFGPSGNYLGAYSPHYFHEGSHTAWGQALNYGEPAMRDLVLENARYWLEEFQFDGLRLDATHAIVDASPRHILNELTLLAHAMSPPRLLIAEDERNLASLVSDTGLDALWADDFHHQARVTMTLERSGYYAAYEPSVERIAETINTGWLYTGQAHPLTGNAHGSRPDALSADALVYCIQNHDQIGNRALGDRLSTQVGLERFRGLSLLLLFLPMTPLLFMGQEWAATTPFLYFTDHDAELGALVTEGRRREFASFDEFADPGKTSTIPDPQAPESFRDSKLRWSERELAEHQTTLELYRAALALRRSDSVLSRSNRAQLTAEARGDVLVVRRSAGRERRTLLMSFAERDVPLSDLASLGRFEGAKPLLQSFTGDGRMLPPGGAVVLAEREVTQQQPENEL